MGNSQSSDDAKAPAANDKSSSSSSSSRRKDGERERSKVRHGPVESQNQNVRMKPQSHAATATRTTQAPPPTTVLVPSTSTVSTSTSTTHAQANISASPASSHSRARSITTGAPKSRADDSISRSPMGNAESRQHRPPSRSSTLPPLATDKPSPSPSSQPVDVPHPPPHNDGFDDLEPPINSPVYGLPGNDFSRPPRLPLPIERDPEPTSPILTPKDTTTPLESHDEDELVPRRASMLSSTTLDDDEVADIETFELEADPFAQKVLTTIQYRGEAKTVFVTGTFARWEKKFRMQKGVDQDGKPLFTLTASLPAGTHHIRFLVDGEMIVTNQYLQTVDFTNSLVNYIEIAAQKPPAEEAQVTVPADPIPIPGAEDVVVESEWTKPAGRRSQEQAPETRDDVSAALEDSLSQTTTSQDKPSQAIPIRQTQHQRPEKPPQPEPKPKKYLERPKYTNEIPELLVHIDYYNEPDKEFDHRRALKAAEHLPQPPSLPLFMSKSILNATTPHKDDASVLTMPNHTVLNHLATSSIKSGVLATSGTTRYKKKFLTTIMYKPTQEDKPVQEEREANSNASAQAQR